jgi:hypothetical protein
MNTGLMDGFNLAWKLALVCQGHSSAALLDSYEFERRPVAKSIVASRAQTYPAERRARDQKMQTKFADPTERHNEAVAQANLDIDYAGSPIVMGDKHDKLAPGERLPDTIGVHLANGEPGKLHELARCQGHAALVLGGASADSTEVARLESEIRARGQTPVIETVGALSARSDDGNPHARLSPASAQRLGVDGIALFVVRPDGYLALRADLNHLEAYSAYLARLRDPPSAIQSR